MPIHGSDYEHRVEIDCITQTNSTIVLLNVTVADSGMYGCYSTGANGTNQTNWTRLTVNDHGKNEYHLFVFLSLFLPMVAARRRRRRRQSGMELLFWIQVAVESSGYQEKGGLSGFSVNLLLQNIRFLFTLGRFAPPSWFHPRAELFLGYDALMLMEFCTGGNSEGRE
uniref:Ig-like domain-containing protein n=1 Tax=Salvator merianae TaxID=96440 RepID=A0A8D0B9G3_SALMN